MFFDVYRDLCKQHGISPSAAAIEMGINKGTVSVWKNKGITPQTQQLQKIADYFGVSVDYLLGKEPKEKPATNDSDEPLEDCIVLHRDGKTSRYKFTREQLDAMAEMIKKFGEEKTDL